MELKEFAGKREGAKVPGTGKVSEKEHEVKIELNRIVREAGNAGIPIFTAYYSQDEGYVYNAMLPEEIASEPLKDQYGRFDEFMRTCIGFNKADAFKAEKVNVMP